MRPLQSLVTLVPRPICTSISVVAYFGPRSLGTSHQTDSHFGPQETIPSIHHCVTVIKISNVSLRCTFIIVQKSLYLFLSCRVFPADTFTLTFQPLTLNCQSQIFTAKWLSQNAKFDVFGITKCQLASVSRFQIVINAVILGPVCVMFSLHIRNIWISTQKCSLHEKVLQSTINTKIHGFRDFHLLQGLWFKQWLIVKLYTAKTTSIKQHVLYILVVSVRHSEGPPFRRYLVLGLVGLVGLGLTLL